MNSVKPSAMLTPARWPGFLQSTAHSTTVLPWRADSRTASITR